MESDKSYSYFFSQLSDRKSSTIHSSSNKTLSLSTNQNSSSNNSTTVQETFQYPLIQVKFRWKDPAEAVYLTGNFCNWKQKFLMPKVDNEFLLVLVRNKIIFNRNSKKGLINTNSQSMEHGNAQNMMRPITTME